MSRLIFEYSSPGRVGVQLPGLSESESLSVPDLPEKYLRGDAPPLPEVSELDVVRHYTNLSRRNFGVDSHFYPLGSCTMKYNPKITEKIAALEGFADLHPLLPQLRGGGMLTQGALRVIHEMQSLLCEITGMDAFTLQPMAGAHGELTGIMLIAAYHKSRGNRKTRVIIPDSAHGTNPASASIAGYSVVTVKTGDDGCMDMQALEDALDDEIAAVMLTSPNTLGLFNPRIAELADMAHAHDALLYYDGANLNAILGKCRPGDLGFDVVHLNLHKTFGTPHGGGGPGSGPVGVRSALVPFMPTSVVVNRTDGTYALEYERKDSIGFIAPFYGNFGVILKAYAYILMLGTNGLVKAAENAVLSANYLQARLSSRFELAVNRRCMHECVFTASKLAEKGVRALDIAKGLIDRGIHPMTVYFPLIVPEAMMIEPTETESLETLDRFIQVMFDLADLAQKDPKAFASMPRTTPVSRLDETLAARKMIFTADRTDG